MNSKKAFFVLLAALFSLNFLWIGCAYFQQYSQSSEAIILLDGTEIPCRILEINDQEILFEALDARYAYQYGGRIPLGQVQWIRVVQGNNVSYLAVDDYLKLHSEEFEQVEESAAKEPMEPEKAAAKQTETKQEIKEKSSKTREAKKNENFQKPSGPPITNSSEGPGLHYQGFLTDTLTQQNLKSGIGLRLPEPPAPPSLLPAPDYADLADFVVASGAAGLVLYRAERFAEEGLKLSKVRQKLVDAIRASKMWRGRKNGLRQAHRIAAARFKEKFPDVATEIKNSLGFRARYQDNPFVQFVIFLHTHGNLNSKSHRREIQLWFGREAEQAIVDILANFDDWYYIAVVSAKSLKL